MFIPAELFLKGMPYQDFDHPTDILHRGNLCYLMTTDSSGDCALCVLNTTPDAVKKPTCQTEFTSNPDLQASIDAFMESHPEYFI